MKNIEYEYRNLPIPGGGYVTGFLFDPNREKVLYIRTDIGGCYRFSYENRHWDSLSESVNMFDLSETYPIAIATDLQQAETLYVISGINEEGTEGTFSLSHDGGKTYTCGKIPCFVHGNLNGSRRIKRHFILLPRRMVCYGPETMEKPGRKQTSAVKNI